MTLLVATARADHGFITSDSLLEPIGSNEAAERSAFIRLLELTTGREIVERNGNLYAPKVFVNSGAKLAGMVIGTVALDGGVRAHAEASAGIDELAVTLPQLLKAMPPNVFGVPNRDDPGADKDGEPIWHCAFVGYSVTAGRVKGFNISSETDLTVEDFSGGSVMHPDWHAAGPHAYAIDKLLKGGMWLATYGGGGIPQLHQFAARNVAWQIEQGKFGERRIGGALHTAIVTKEGAEVFINGDLDAAAAA
jgi:hypothetical protein